MIGAGAALGSLTRGPVSRATWRPGRDGQAERIPAPAPARTTDEPPFSGAGQVVVCGGGIAGLAAAVGLAERGVRVTLLERESTLGGRVRSWPVDEADAGGRIQAGDPGNGVPRTMSRGFHAFFRQYYNLRGLLRRADPELTRLRPIDDYPLLHRDGTQDSFAGVPRTPPLNLMAFVAKSPTFTARDLLRVDVERAMGLLDVDFPATFSAYDGISAADVLDRLRFPQRARSLALEVFARSFFADPADFSGGELVAMFHAYFLGSAEGLLFDVPTGDYDTTLWAPLGRYLTGLGADVRTGVTATGLDSDEHGLTVRVDGTEELPADAVVLAVDRGPLQELVAAAPWLGGPAWREAVAALTMAPRFVVLRLWYDRPVAPGTPPFVGTAAFGMLDNVSAVHLFEDEAAAWAARHGGCVMELHGYAIGDDVSDEDADEDLRRHFLRIHPELAGVEPVHTERLTMADCPLAGTDPWAARPGVRTPDPRVVLAGDGIRCELPVALMERAATTGFQAANMLLGARGLAGHDLWSVPTAGRHPRSVAALLPAARWVSRS